jgi:hypothetical protein
MGIEPTANRGRDSQVAPPVVYRFLAWRRESAWLGRVGARSRGRSELPRSGDLSGISVVNEGKTMREQVRHIIDRGPVPTVRGNGLMTPRSHLHVRAAWRTAHGPPSAPIPRPKCCVNWASKPSVAAAVAGSANTSRTRSGVKIKPSRRIWFLLHSVLSWRRKRPLVCALTTKSGAAPLLQTRPCMCTEAGVRTQADRERPRIRHHVRRSG